MFSLKDTAGKIHDLDLYRSKKAVVVAFSGTGCPLVKQYLPRITELAAEYAKQSVQFLAINSNRQDSLQEIAAHAKENSLTFPVLKDERNVVADQFGARRTPEAFVIDQQGVIRYRGRIDDQFGVGYQRPAIGRRDLATAIEEVLAGKPVSVPETEAAGCLIGRVTQPRDQGVTYANQVARIIQNRCQACHRPGQVGPFTLLSYDDASGWGPMIKEVVQEKRMPPWHADPQHGKFTNDRSLTSDELATLVAWVDSGMPEGNASDLPPPRQFSEEWALGKPDQVLQMSEEFTVPASGRDMYRYFRLPTGLEENRWVRAVEIRPGNRRVVHHVIAMVRDANTEQRQSRPLGALLAPVMGTGNSTSAMGWLAAMAPGNEAMVYPPATAKLLPAGCNIVFQMHYHPSGVEEKDRTSIGLYYSDEPSPELMRTYGIANPLFAIPPGAKNYEIKGLVTTPADVKLWSLMPHMHLRGHDIQYRAVYPDGNSEMLLVVPRWDFNWQTTYRLTEPKSLPKGTRVEVTAHYDNSADNPNNPNPNESVRWGEPTHMEMMIGFVDYTLER